MIDLPAAAKPGADRVHSHAPASTPTGPGGLPNLNLTSCAKRSVHA
jgi:hypothetical protein